MGADGGFLGGDGPIPSRRFESDPPLCKGRAQSHIARMKPIQRETWRARLLVLVAKGRASVRRRIPPGLRWPIGLVLISLGFLGFLPVLGFWMIPLGLAVAAMDIRPVWRRLRGFQGG